MKFLVVFKDLRSKKVFSQERETDYPEYFESQMNEVAVNLDWKVLNIKRINGGT